MTSLSRSHHFPGKWFTIAIFFFLLIFPVCAEEEIIRLPSLDSSAQNAIQPLPVPSFHMETIILQALDYEPPPLVLPVPPDPDIPKPVKVFDKQEEADPEVFHDEVTDDGESIDAISPSESSPFEPEPQVPTQITSALKLSESLGAGQNQETEIIQEEDSVEELFVPEKMSRLVSAFTSKEVKLLLPGRGWVLLPGDMANHSFLRKEYGEDSTTFVFFFSDPGVFTGELEQYSPSTPGISALMAVEFLVSETIKVPVAAVIEERTENTEIVSESIVPERGEDALLRGDYETAALLFRQAFREENKAEDLEAAFEAAFMNASFLVIIDIIDDWLEILLPEAEQVSRVLEALENEMGYEEEKEQLENYLLELGNPSEEDNAASLMKKAQQWESPGDTRNYRKAYELYDEIIERFPFSKEALKARERRDYLDRHFFRIN